MCRARSGSTGTARSQRINKTKNDCNEEIMRFLCKFILSLLLTASMCVSVASCKKDGGGDNTATILGSESTNVESDTSEDQSGGDQGGDQSGGDQSGDNNDGEYEMLDLKVMSFNIRYYNAHDTGIKGWDSRKTAVTDFIKNMEASIVCLQEVRPEQLDHLTSALSEDYSLIWYGREPNNQGEGLAIVYNKDIWTLADQGCFWLSETPNVPSKGFGASLYRICVVATLRHKETGAKIDVYNVHLDHTSENIQTKEIELVLNKIKDSENPVYLCGDFNCQTDGGAYKKASAAMNDSMALSPVTDSGVTYQNWGGSGQMLLDYNLFSKDDFELITFDIREDKWGANNANYLSDHFAIVSTVKMKYVHIEYPDININGLTGAIGDDVEHTKSY